MINNQDLTNSVLEHDHVCSKHLVSGRAANTMKRNDPDWVPSLNLGHGKCALMYFHRKLQAMLQSLWKWNTRIRERALIRQVALEKGLQPQQRNTKRQKINRPSKKIRYFFWKWVWGRDWYSISNGRVWLPVSWNSSTLWILNTHVALPKF